MLTPATSGGNTARNKCGSIKNICGRVSQLEAHTKYSWGTQGLSYHKIHGTDGRYFIHAGKPCHGSNIISKPCLPTDDKNSPADREEPNPGWSYQAALNNKYEPSEIQRRRGKWSGKIETKNYSYLTRLDQIGCCWVHGWRVIKGICRYASKTKNQWHQDRATLENIMRGPVANKDWFTG